MVFNSTFNNISDLLVEKTTDLSQVIDKHNVVFTTPRLGGPIDILT